MGSLVDYQSFKAERKSFVLLDVNVNELVCGNRGQVVVFIIDDVVGFDERRIKFICFKSSVTVE